jgi:hypothetical protein
MSNLPSEPEFEQVSELESMHAVSQTPDCFTGESSDTC